jgi:hypothetical protein
MVASDMSVAELQALSENDNSHSALLICARASGAEFLRPSTRHRFPSLPPFPAHLRDDTPTSRVVRLAGLALPPRGRQISPTWSPECQPPAVDLTAHIVLVRPPTAGSR